MSIDFIWKMHLIDLNDYVLKKGYRFIFAVIGNSSIHDGQFRQKTNQDNRSIDKSLNWNISNFLLKKTEPS